MSDQFTDEQLLKMAMGVPDEDTEEFTELMKLKSEWELVPTRGRDKLTKRRKMRNHIFKIIKRTRRELDLTPELEAIKQIIDPQLDANIQINWSTFTFRWDLHPKNHAKIIQKDSWFKEGGSYDELGALRPTAFTEQEID